MSGARLGAADQVFAGGTQGPASASPAPRRPHSHPPSASAAAAAAAAGSARGTRCAVSPRGVVGASGEEGEADGEAEEQGARGRSRVPPGLTGQQQGKRNEQGGLSIVVELHGERGRCSLNSVESGRKTLLGCRSCVA